jgi:hypothetical protein
MNHTEIAGALSEALGQTFTYIPISVEKFAQTLTNRGFGAHIVQHLSNVAIDYRNGVFAGTNDIVETIGKPNRPVSRNSRSATRSSSSTTSPGPTGAKPPRATTTRARPNSA